jgi:NADPH:quinone reductase-like Zn-dependent oxidoreductase
MLVPSSYAARAPREVPLVHAGAMPIVALTAHECLVDLLKVQRGDVVLITAAAGGVGHLAVQIAARLGAHVVATASARNHELLRALGAETLIDYTAGDVAAAIRAKYPGGVDKALNGVTGDAAREAARTLREGGRMVDLPGSLEGAALGIHVDSDYVVRADGERLARIARMIDAGELRVHVEDTLPFERAPQALERVLQKHVRGVLALEVSRDA